MNLLSTATTRFASHTNTLGLSHNELLLLLIICCEIRSAASRENKVTGCLVLIKFRFSRQKLIKVSNITKLRPV